MANLVITPADVQQASDADIAHRIARVFMVAGTVVWLHPNGQVQPARNNGGVDFAAALGIVLHSAGAGQPVAYIKGGDVDLGAVLVLGETYIIGSADGSIAPIADILAGQFTTVLGIATLANNLKVNIIQGGTAHA